MRNNLNKLIDQRSFSYHSQEEHNEFLEQIVRSNTNEDYLKVNNQDQSSTQKAKKYEPRLGRSRCVFLVNHNRSIRQILRQMRQKERHYKEKVAERQRLIREDRQYNKLVSQFDLVERRVKTRLAIEQKRLERERNKTIEKSSSTTPIKNNLSELVITEEMKQSSQDKKQQLENPAGKSQTLKKRQLKEKPTSLDHSKLAQNRSMLVTKKKDQEHRSKSYIRKPLQIPIKGAKSRVSHHDVPLTTIKRKINRQRISTQPVQSMNHSVVTKIDYLKKLRIQESSLQKQLQDLYKNDSSDLTRVASLVDKIEQKRRLRLKNMEEKDYKSVESKVKLLNFLYKH